MERDLKKEFNFYTNIFILFILFFGGFVWADSNGVWHYASDIRSGIFGADEDGVDGGFSFISDVTFNADVNLNNVSNCAGKLITQANGTIYCGVDNVNDADFDSTNEYPIAGTGINVNGRVVSVNTSYVQEQIITIPNGMISSFYLSACPTGWILADGSSGTPNLSGKFILGEGGGYLFGSSGGESTHQLTVAELPSHRHISGARNPFAIYGTYDYGTPVQSAKGSNGAYDRSPYTSYAGSNQAHNNMPPYYTLIYCMSLS